MSSSSEPKVESERTTPGLLLDLVTLALLVLVAARLPLIPDEAYYWTWSQSLTWAYFDHPPLIAWVIRAARTLLGNEALALRTPSLFAMAAAVWLSGRTAAILSPGSSRPVQLSRRMLLASPMFMIGLVPATPDGLLAFGAAAAAFTVVRATTRGTSVDWVACGFVLTSLVGIKHYGGLIALGAAVGIATRPEGRRWPVVRWFCLGSLLGLAALSPWLIAELNLGDKSSLAYQLDRVLLARSRFSGPVSLPVAFGSMLGTLGPISAVALFLLGCRGLRAPHLGPRALYAGALALIAACFVAVWLGSGEANWPLPALVFAAPALAVVLGQLRAFRPLIAGLVAVQVLILIYLAHIVHPFLPLPLTRDPAARGAGYAELGEEVRRHADQLGAKHVGARTYQLASLLWYHGDESRPVFELGMDRKSQFDRSPPTTMCPGDRVVTVTRAAKRQLPAYLRPVAPAKKIFRRDGARLGEEAFVLSVSEVIGFERCASGSPP